jgi:hypothetical protein
MGPSIHCYPCLGVDFTKHGVVWSSPSDVMVMAEAPNQHRYASHIHIICKQSGLATCYAVDGHMGPPLHCYAYVQFWGSNKYTMKLVVWLSPCVVL